MSLNDIISGSHKEIAGSRTKNRLTVQISYAIQLIMEFYSTDFLIMMDYIVFVKLKIQQKAANNTALSQRLSCSCGLRQARMLVASECCIRRLLLDCGAGCCTVGVSVMAA